VAHYSDGKLNAPNNALAITGSSKTDGGEGWHYIAAMNSHAQAEADARLIAAAPELLEALIRLVRDADFEPDNDYLQNANKGCVAVHRSGIERARAAIAKATA
jgi:hypothetical protein